ncbi:hypothetical protein FDF26_15340 [Clostridium botulinum]|nr:hypothetical protein [Clostridium botulinum]
MCKEMAKELRSKLKEIGYNSRMVSVRSSYSSIDLSIKSADVDFKTVEDLANKYESIRRDEATGEILAGGNIYVNVEYDYDFKESFSNEFIEKATEIEATIKDSNDFDNIDICNNVTAYTSDYNMIIFRIYLNDGVKRMKCYNCVEGIKNVLADLFLTYKIDVRKGNKLNSIESTNVETIEEVNPVEKITEIKKNIDCKIVFNEDKNGIELYFTDKPSEEVRNNIKANGFRWSKYNKCWYSKDTETTRGYLQELGLLNKDNKQENTEIKTEELKEIEEPKIIIDETLAKRCKENMSFSDYKEGSATQEYHNTVEEVAEKINSAKEKVSDDESKIKLDYLLQKFKKDYANWVNKHNSNGSNHVSVMISGRGNYNISKHEKYVAREGKLWHELENIMDIDTKIDKIINSENIIKSSDKNAIDKLRKKLEQEEKQHQEIKEYNKMARKEGKEPYASYVLQNSNQRIKNIKDRIKHLEKLSQQEIKEIEINGIKIVDNVEANRLQIIFNDKPNEDIRKKLKSNGFRWSPSNNAWQRYRGSEAERKAKMIIESMELLNKAQ